MLWGTCFTLVESMPGKYRKALFLILTTVSGVARGAEGRGPPAALLGGGTSLTKN